jgi:hypothetical protein
MGNLKISLYFYKSIHLLAIKNIAMNYKTVLKRKYFPLSIVFAVLFAQNACNKSVQLSKEIHPIEIQAFEVELLAQLPLNCVEVEWPNKLNQVLDNATEIGTPKELHPVFYGCFDWHSAVHAHWSMLRLWPLLTNEEKKQEITDVFSQNFTKENFSMELDYLNRPSSAGWERPYGWGWLLKLGAELDTKEGAFWKDISHNVEPLCLDIRDRFIDFLPKLLYPIRSGEHSNIAFAMALALDYAQQMSDEEFAGILKENALRLFADDLDCPLEWEPGGYDFISPCLEEAYLMTKVMDNENYIEWMNGFMPDLLDPKFTLEVAKVADRSDGKLVHLDGLNFSRARCLYGISAKLGDIPHLNYIANEHIKTAMAKINDGNYAGEHWLASFAVAAFTDTPR